MAQTTWRAELVSARSECGDTTGVVAVAPGDSTLDIPFNGGYGTSQGPDVLVWTETHVYFPVVFDGKEWLGSAPRNPTPRGQEHLGGE